MVTFAPAFLVFLASTVNLTSLYVILLKKYVVITVVSALKVQVSSFIVNVRQVSECSITYFSISMGVPILIYSG